MGSENGSAGSSVYNRELATRLASAGHQVEVVCEPPLRHPHQDYKRHVLDTVEQRALIWRLESMTNEFYFNWQLKRLGLSTPDLVIGLSQQLLKGHSRLFPTVPWIYFPHALDIETEYGPYSQLSMQDKISRWHKTRIQTWALGSADSVVRFSRMGVDYICGRYQVPSEQQYKYCVNYPGLTNSAVSEKWLANTGDIRFLMVGSLISRKRMDDAIRSLSTIDAATNWRLDIIGDGPERANLESLVADEGLQEKVRFLGRIDEITEAYADADLLLLPSRSEGFGLVIIEAMANGLPVLAYSNEAPDTYVVSDELIDHGVN